jgi:hypothetical protein
MEGSCDYAIAKIICGFVGWCCVAPVVCGVVGPFHGGCCCAEAASSRNCAAAWSTSAGACWCDVGNFSVGIGFTGSQRPGRAAGVRSGFHAADSAYAFDA